MQETLGGGDRDIAVIVGQLLNATATATQSLQNITQVVQQNVQAIAVAANTLELVERQVEDLDKIVRNAANDQNIMSTLQQHTTQLTQLRENAQHLRNAVTALHRDMSVLQKQETKETATKNLLWTLLQFSGWLIATAIAIASIYFSK
jgi:chromosome segregation ATPase